MAFQAYKAIASEFDPHGLKCYADTANFEIRELWYSEDLLSRADFKWLNVIITKFF